jgi:polysaccharide biosynthesis transport protein
MDSSASPKAAPSLQLGDIYYILFRHKWKIIICAVVGLAAAAAVYKLLPPAYQSEAKLFIRFVITEGQSSGPTRDDSVTKSPDQRGETIINSEMQILTSLDLSDHVARNIGPEKVLAATSGGKSMEEAAAVIRSGLSVEVPPKSSVIRLSYKHPDPAMVQPILREVVSSYLKRHIEIHRAAGGDFLAQETDQLRSRLAQTEEELRKVSDKAGIVTLEASKQEFARQIARIREEIFTNQAQLAERTSVYEQMTKSQPAAPTAGEAEPPPITPAQVDAYQKIVTRLSELQQRLRELLTQLTDDTPWVKQVRTQIAEAEGQKSQMETAHPALIRTRPAAAPNQPNGDGYDQVVEGARINALQAKIKTLLQQLEQIRSEATNLDKLEVSILELRRRKELEESNYRYYSASLEQSRIKEAMGEGRVSNISQVQSPTPPFRDWMPIKKLAGGIAVGGFVLGLAWAFAIEFFLDHTLRRPADVERQLRLPLFLSIPRLVAKKARGKHKKKPALSPADPTQPTEGAASALLTPSATLPNGNGLNLEPFHQTLRDRLISYFESINLQHRPKLVAVTGLGRGNGVTTTAAGLARSFSETGGGGRHAHRRRSRRRNGPDRRGQRVAGGHDPRPRFGPTFPTRHADRPRPAL